MEEVQNSEFSLKIMISAGSVCVFQVTAFQALLFLLLTCGYKSQSLASRSRSAWAVCAFYRCVSVPRLFMCVDIQCRAPGFSPIPLCAMSHYPLSQHLSALPSLSQAAHIHCCRLGATLMRSLTPPCLKCLAGSSSLGTGPWPLSRIRIHAEGVCGGREIGRAHV